MANQPPNEVPFNYGAGSQFSDIMDQNDGTGIQLDAETWQRFLDSIPDDVHGTNNGDRNSLMDVDSHCEAMPPTPNVSPPAGIAPVNVQQPGTPCNNYIMASSPYTGAMQQAQTPLLYNPHSPAVNSCSPAVNPNSPAIPKSPVVNPNSPALNPQSSAVNAYSPVMNPNSPAANQTLSQQLLVQAQQSPAVQLFQEYQTVLLHAQTPTTQGVPYTAQTTANQTNNANTSLNQMMNTHVPGSQTVPNNFHSPDPQYVQIPASQTLPYNPHAPIGASNWQQNAEASPPELPLDILEQSQITPQSGHQYAQSPASQAAYNPRSPVVGSNGHLNAEASAPELPQLTLEQKEIKEKGHKMQLRVFYKKLRIRCSNVVADGDSRHDIDNAAGFVLFHDTVREDIPDTVTRFPLPVVENLHQHFSKKDADIILDICGDMKDGLHVNFNPDTRIIYATRYSISGVFFWANDKSNSSRDTVKLERKTPTPVFDFNAYYTRLNKMNPEKIGEERNPVVVFTIGFPWTLGSGSLFGQHVHIEVTPIEAVKKLYKLNLLKSKIKSINKSSVKQADAYKSNEPNSLEAQMN